MPIKAPIEIPIIQIPPIEEIETISIPLPTAEVPFYTPLVIPPSDLRATEQIQIQIMKPVIKTTWKKIRGKKRTKT